MSRQTNHGHTLDKDCPCGPTVEMVPGTTHRNEVVRVRCPHREGLAYRDGATLTLLPCDCNDPSEVVGVLCPTCGPTATERHPRHDGVTRCVNCKEWLTGVTTPAPTVVDCAGAGGCVRDDADQCIETTCNAERPR